MTFYTYTFGGSPLPFASFPMTRKRYNRPFDEVSSYRSFQMENGNTKVFINALGVSAKDIEISVEKAKNGYNILVSGKTTVETLGDYSIDYNFFTEEEISKISPSFANGILTLDIEWKKPVQPDVEIAKIVEN